MRKVLLLMILTTLVFVGCTNDLYNEDTPLYGHKKNYKFWLFAYDPKFNETDLTITMKGSISVSGDVPPEVTDYGFLYGYKQSSNFETDYKRIKPEDSFTSFTSTIPIDPESSDNFYYVAYVTLLGNTYFSYAKKVALYGAKIYIDNSPSFKDITYEKATISSSCYVGNPTLFPITERGFCYINTREIQDRNPTIKDDRIVADVVEGERKFSATITGLTEYSFYKVRAYAINSAGTTYSKAYTTIITNTPSNFTPMCDIVYYKNSAPNVITGKIISDRSYYVTEKGFCYNNRGVTPTINDTRIIIGEGLGEFNHTFDLPSGKYYFRSYAINQAGLGYSAAVQEIIIP